MDTSDILICYDGSAASQLAVREVAALHPGASVTVLSVWRPMETFVMAWTMVPNNLSDLDGEAKQGAEHLAHAGGELAKGLGLRVHEHTARAPMSVARAILDWCDEEHPRLIALGATGASTLSDIMFGSVANAVIHHATVPVLLVRLPRTAH